MAQDRQTSKAVQVTETRLVNHETGEITHEMKADLKVIEKEPNYVKLYLDQIVKLSEIKGWTSNVLYELLGDAKYATEGQIIVVNSGYKGMIAEKLKIKPQSVTNAINELKKKDIIFKVRNGVFMLNPQMFGKGDWKSVKRLRYEVELSEMGTTITLKEKVTEKPSSAEILNEQLKKRGEELTEEQLKTIEYFLSIQEQSKQSGEHIQ